MKNIFIVVILAAMIVTSCAKSGIVIRNGDVSTGEDFQITYLFEAEGIRVYRFYDAGYYRYFSIGSGKFQGQVQTQQSGKTRTSWNDGIE